MEQEGVSRFETDEKFNSIMVASGIMLAIALAIAILVSISTTTESSGLPISRLQSGRSKTSDGRVVTEYYDPEQERRWWVTDDGKVLDCGTCGEIKKYHGSALDAVEYDAPAFSDGDVSYRITDRSTEQSWWLVHIDGEWVVV